MITKNNKEKLSASILPVIYVMIGNPPLQGMLQALPKKTCEANPAGENSSFIFTVSIKSVPLHHFKLVHPVLHVAVKELFEIQL